MNEWKPIESAPKDGTNILVLCPAGVRVARWYSCNSHWGVVPGNWHLRATHRMPVPDRATGRPDE